MSEPDLTASRRAFRGELEATVDRGCTLRKTLDLEKEFDGLVETSTALDVTRLFCLVSSLLLEVPQTETVCDVVWDRLDSCTFEGRCLEEVAGRGWDHARRH